MSEINWGLITNGGTFESLMHAILFMENASTILFGRVGKDGAQDARSADGTVVYQAKYRSNLNMDGTIELALKELESIKKYRTSGHTNFKHWEHAQKWVLFANVEINTNDVLKWNDKVVPKFSKAGLKAEIFHKSEINGTLLTMPEVRDVFFGHENRVFVSLKEAHNIIHNNRELDESIDHDMIGRESELSRCIEAINSTDKIMIPVIGPGGIGKTRFLYECLISLTANGWRVLWGLPESMSLSSQWFRLLNGTQKTCVALDDPQDARLLQVVIEQISTVERSNWRILLSNSNERTDSLRKYRSNRHVAEPIHLLPLVESDSKKLLKSLIGEEIPEAWLHNVHCLAQGNPGWLCLIATLAKQGKLKELPTNTDRLASEYLESCLRQFGADAKEAQDLLRWLSLLGTQVDDNQGDNQEGFHFLERQVGTDYKLRDLLKRLVYVGLIKNWGNRKRLFAIDSIIIRHSILSDWLFDKDQSGLYIVNQTGEEIILSLLNGKFPCLDKAIQSLSELAVSRLDSRESKTFLKPVFDLLGSKAEHANIIVQNQIVQLAKSLGKADPEGALDLLVQVRENMASDQEVENTFWGKQYFKQENLLAKLSWKLFTLADYVDSNILGHRFIAEFRNLAILEKGFSNSLESDKSPFKLICRLLNDPRKTSVFLQPARKMVMDDMNGKEWFPFVGELAKSLLNPDQESTEWVSSWTVRFLRNPLVPDSERWKYMESIRDRIFEILQADHSNENGRQLWKLLSDSHNSFHYLLGQGAVNNQAADRYYELLKKDLKKCAEILASRGITQEAAYARAMWHWHLQSDSKSDLAALAQECEKRYNRLSKWRLQDFFRFDLEKNLESETVRVAECLLEATDISVYSGFFRDADQYLAATRLNRDSADSWRIEALANKMIELLPSELLFEKSLLFVFICQVLSTKGSPNALEFSFVINICRIKLKNLKSYDVNAASAWLDQIIELSASRSALLNQLYWNAGPDSVGILHKFELRLIEKYRDEFTFEQWFWLNGIFTGANVVEDPITILNDSISRLSDTKTKGNCLRNFVRIAYLAFLRFNHTPPASLVEWIFVTIGEMNLDGNLLGDYHFEWIRDKSGFKATMRQFTDLIRSRIEFSVNLDPTERFDIVPRNFQVADWCAFNTSDANDQAAFEKLCYLALGKSFIALYWLPKYLVQIDPEGVSVNVFVKNYLKMYPSLNGKDLARLSYLASEYASDPLSWRNIAIPICERTSTMKREDREHVFFGLTKKESGVIEGSPGKISPYYTNAVELARILQQTEPIDSCLRNYRQWILERAEDDLRRERELVNLEESADE